MISEARAKKLMEQASQLEDELRKAHESEVRSGNWKALAFDVMTRITQARLDMHERHEKSLDRIMDTIHKKRKSRIKETRL